MIIAAENTARLSQDLKFFLRTFRRYGLIIDQHESEESANEKLVYEK